MKRDVNTSLQLLQLSIPDKIQCLSVNAAISNKIRGTILPEAGAGRQVLIATCSQLPLLQPVTNTGTFSHQSLLTQLWPVPTE